MKFFDLFSEKFGFDVAFEEVVVTERDFFLLFVIQLVRVMVLDDWTAVEMFEILGKASFEFSLILSYFGL